MKDDTISRTAAIEAIDRYYKDKRYITRSRTILSAICRDMKSTMDSLPSAQPDVPDINDGDIISRQAAIDAVMECYDNDELFEVYEWKLNELPPIQQKKGRWIKLDMHRGMADHKCSVCEQECYVPTCMGEPMYAYCPNCGADMRGEL